MLDRRTRRTPFSRWFVEFVGSFWAEEDMGLAILLLCGVWEMGDHQAQTRIDLFLRAEFCKL